VSTGDASEALIAEIKHRKHLEQQLCTRDSSLLQAQQQLAASAAEVTELRAALRTADAAAAALQGRCEAAVQQAATSRDETAILRAELQRSRRQLTAVAAAHAEELAAATAAQQQQQQQQQQQLLPAHTEAVSLPTCAVCLDAAVAVLLQPCKHLVLCSACAELETMLLCPVCRADITEKITVHM
jgi:putative NADH-flavin reductase